MEDITEKIIKKWKEVNLKDKVVHSEKYLNELEMFLEWFVEQKELCKELFDYEV